MVVLVDVVGVDESGEVFARLALDACLDNLEIGYAVRPFKLAALLDVQMGGGLEEQRTAEECALRYHNHTATIGSCPVDDGLNGIGLDNGGIVLNAIIGDDIPAAERCWVDFRGVAEPGVHLCAVGPFVGHGVDGEEKDCCREERADEKVIVHDRKW